MKNFILILSLLCTVSMLSDLNSVAEQSDIQLKKIEYSQAQLAEFHR